MDTKSNQKTRRFTKLAWCEERGKDPYKKARSRSQSTGKAGSTGAACTNAKEVKVAPVGAWLLAAALVIAVMLLGGLNAS